MRRRAHRTIVGVSAISCSSLMLMMASAHSQDTSSRERTDTTVDYGLPRGVAGRSAEMLGAFYGLYALPLLANLICRDQGE